MERCHLSDCSEETESWPGRRQMWDVSDQGSCPKGTREGKETITIEHTQYTQLRIFAFAAFFAWNIFFSLRNLYIAHSLTSFRYLFKYHFLTNLYKHAYITLYFHGTYCSLPLIDSSFIGGHSFSNVSFTRTENLLTTTSPGRVGAH